MSQQPEFIYCEKPAIDLFQQMGYEYYDGSKRDERGGDITQVVLHDRLKKAIKKINPWLSDENMYKAYSEITSVDGASLMEINQKVWHLLRHGFDVVQVFDGKEEFRTIHYLDYLQPERNDFLVVNQMKFKGKGENSIPDIMVYVNGLPLAVIECKSSSTGKAWDKAYEDLAYYQKNSERLFHFNQICCGLCGVDARYGAISAPQKFYSLYKKSEDETLPFIDEEASPQSILLAALFEKHHFLEIIRHFVLFELEKGHTIKKLPRYHQIRATNKTIAKLQTGKGGVVWHTQGSGKSITMAYVARKLQAPEYGFENPTILILTDRNELDGQIHDTLNNIGFKNVSKANSVADLEEKLRNTYGGIITSTLQKFQENEVEIGKNSKPPKVKPQKSKEEEEEEEEDNKEERIKTKRTVEGNTLTIVTKIKINDKWYDKEKVVEEIKPLLMKENLYVLVDEAHRSQYGFLAAFMRSVLPKAKFVAFTGTPISKEERSTLGEFYGGTDYIDVYTIKQAVEDGATVALFYEEGIARMDVKREALDKEFEEKFGDESEEKKHKLKGEALKAYQSSEARIEDIAKHVLQHYGTKIYPNGHKAMLVCSGRPAAIQYQRIFTKLKAQGVHHFETKVVVSLGSPKEDAIAREYYETLKWNKENPKDKRPVWVVDPNHIKNETDLFKLPFGKEEERALSGAKKYDNTAIIIVSDMLLTGWDAPIVSCLYLDKSLKEHNLLQAIARVNRSKDGKSAGFIMDYCGIGSHLNEALEIFSGELKVEDLMKNLNKEIPKLSLCHTKLVSFFQSIGVDRKYERVKFLDKALHYIEPLNKRDEFKELLKQFNRSINIVLPNPEARRFESDFRLFNELKYMARNAFPDDTELSVSKEESKMLQEMIYKHLESQGVYEVMEAPVAIIDRKLFEKGLSGDSDKTKELKKRNSLKHTVRVGMDRNPDFYKPLAQRLEELIKMKEAQQMDDAQLLLAYNELADEMAQEHQEADQLGFTKPYEVAIYNTMKTIYGENAADATQTVFDLIGGELKIVDWQKKGRVKKEMTNKITRYLKTSMEREEAKRKAKEIVEIIEKNDHA
ncbi:DEAD/DEAH box helicase family protein [Halosquirtibacter laminarini]|uniref:DEAD/DEAH box helicase family protein n=1 Tax=Halosquirtibacter laminarini TaxID=3374600 RepID=A0AC61NET2_9BACT|nr:DEAD/DEAH box helicase family protein [Prolixibacteraceae bacterium]